MIKCDICGEELNIRENQIYDEISNDNIPCFCSIAKRIKKLEDKVIKNGTKSRC